MSVGSILDTQKLLKLAIEWEDIWKRRPFENSNGLGCQGAFALYYFLKEMNPAPELVVECGTWRGFSTWVIKMAVPDAKIICSDPILASKQFLKPEVFTPEYRVKDAEYTWQDFSNIEINIPDEKRDRAVVFFDDHQNKIPRLEQAINKGFKHIIYDDNVPYKYTHTSFEYLFEVEKDERVKKYFKRYEVFPPMYSFKHKTGRQISGLVDKEEFYFESMYQSKEVYSWVSKVEVLSDCFKKREINKNKIVHVCFNNMHVQPLIEILKSEGALAEYEQAIFIGKSRSIPNYDVDISNNPNAYYFDEKSQLESVLSECLADDVVGVFFHGLFFSWQKQLVESIGNKKNTVWVMWGGDLYNPINQGKPMHAIVKNLYGVSTWWDGDYDVFLSTYGKKKRVPFRYYGGKDYAHILPVSQKEKLIFVGNSGDPQNQHEEILVMLSKKDDIANYNIVVPFGYNAPVGYEQKLRNKIAEINLEKNVVFISEKIEPNIYFEWLSKAEMLVLAHNRQQGGANAFAAMLYGTKLVMREYISTNGGLNIKNPIWCQLEKLTGSNIFSYNEFCDKKNVADVFYPEHYDLDAVRKSLQCYLSKEKVVESIANAFEILKAKTS